VSVWQHGNVSVCLLFPMHHQGVFTPIYVEEHRFACKTTVACRSTVTRQATTLSTMAQDHALHSRAAYTRQSSTMLSTMAQDHALHSHAAYTRQSLLFPVLFKENLQRKNSEKKHFLFYTACVVLVISYVHVPA